MDEELYMAESEEESPETEQTSDDSENTALLPRDFFEGKDLEPGTRCEVEIVHGYEDEVEVKYIPHKKEGEDRPMRSAMEDAEMEMDGMMEA